MPEELHGELAQAAAQDGLSLNQFISNALARAVGWSDDDAELDESGSPVRAAQARRSSNRSPAQERTRRRADLITQNRLMIALAANFVIVLVAAAIALGMLIAAWRS